MNGKAMYISHYTHLVLISASIKKSRLPPWGFGVLNDFLMVENLKPELLIMKEEFSFKSDA